MCQNVNKQAKNLSNMLEHIKERINELLPEWAIEALYVASARRLVEVIDDGQNKTELELALNRFSRWEMAYADAGFVTFDPHSVAENSCQFKKRSKYEPPQLFSESYQNRYQH